MQGPRLSNPVRSPAMSFPYRKCPSYFRLLLRYRPRTRPGRHLPGSGSGGGGRKSCGPLWRPLMALSSGPGPLVAVVAFVLAGAPHPVDVGIFLTSWDTASLCALLRS